MIDHIKNRLYQCPVPIIGLTGGIACGKSTVNKLFLTHHIDLIDADQLVKEIYQEHDSFLFIKKNCLPKILPDKMRNRISKS